MEKHISLKEKLKKISSAIEIMSEERINLIEKDILLQDIRDLYVAVNAITIIDNDFQNITDDPFHNEAEIEVNETVEVIQTISSQIITSETIREEISYIKENEQQSFRNEPLKEEEDIKSFVTDNGIHNVIEEAQEEITSIRNDDFSIEFLDEPGIIEEEPEKKQDDVVMETVTQPVNNEVTEAKIDAEPGMSSNTELNKQEKPHRHDNRKPDAEQASLFSNTSFSTETKTVGEQFITNRVSLNEVLAQKNQQDISTVMNLKPVSDIRSAIGIGDRFLFIRELFGGNSDLFEETVSYLNSLNSFRDAHTYLTNKFEWNGTQDTVTSFINIVKRRYI